MKCRPYETPWATTRPEESVRGHMVRCPECPWRDRAEGVVTMFSGWEPCSDIDHKPRTPRALALLQRRALRVALRQPDTELVSGETAVVLISIAKEHHDVVVRHAQWFSSGTQHWSWQHFNFTRTPAAVVVVNRASGLTVSDHWWVQRELRRAIRRLERVEKQS